ncbi:hypothetical protein UFOVP137_32 [uncultured Caudovirales phage]|uniref:Uncharacterized protein n=1 Tax=uncultured Caudovirales phage TaxID=2100421 RepID=A0A6J5LBH0_9CAUD|nr:hypothetical protein UFOVP137_32 [uncultured Caudovirales phage]
MANLISSEHRITAMSTIALEKVRALEAFAENVPQIDVETHHAIHGGMYARTIKLPAGCVLTGAFIKVPTMLVVHGACTVYVGDETVHLDGHQVIAASAGRKQAFVSHEDTDLTMIFATSAQSVEQAEDEFTDEGSKLMSRKPWAMNVITITGE